MTRTIEGEWMKCGLSSIRSAFPVYSRIIALRAVQTWRGSKELFNTNTLSVSIEWFSELKTYESPCGEIILSIQQGGCQRKGKDGAQDRLVEGGYAHGSTGSPRAE